MELLKIQEWSRFPYSTPRQSARYNTDNTQARAKPAQLHYSKPQSRTRTSSTNTDPFDIITSYQAIALDLTSLPKRIQTDPPSSSFPSAVFQLPTLALVQVQRPRNRTSTPTLSVFDPSLTPRPHPKTHREHPIATSPLACPDFVCAATLEAGPRLRSQSQALRPAPTGCKTRHAADSLEHSVQRGFSECKILEKSVRTAVPTAAAARQTAVYETVSAADVARLLHYGPNHRHDGYSSRRHYDTLGIYGEGISGCE